MIEQVFSHAWAWIIAGLVIGALEILLPGVFLLWVGLGALATGLVLTLAPAMAPAWQMLVFALAMLVSVGAGAWLQHRGRRAEPEPFLNREMQAMVGRQYLAITDFTAGHGRIEVGDSSYGALSDEPVRRGDVVRVTAIADGRPKVAKVAPP